MNTDSINRSAVSRGTGIDLAHISRIFNRKSRPSIGYARKISSYLGITTDELCDMLGINGVNLRKTTNPKGEKSCQNQPRHR